MHNMLDSKDDNSPQRKKVDKTKLKPGELIHMYFALYNETSIRGFTSMLTVVCENNIMMWIFLTESKLSSALIIYFILTIVNNEEHPCKCVRVDEYDTLEKSTDVTNLIVDDLNIFMYTTGGDASYIDINIEIHNIFIHNMVRTGLLEINQHEKKGRCEA